MTGKSAYVEMIEKKLEEVDVYYRKLKQKGKMAKIDAEIEYTMKLDELNKKKEDLSERLSEFKKSSGEGWDSLKAGFEKAYGELKVALDEAKSKFK